jgi:hypothetical protein
MVGEHEQGVEDGKAVTGVGRAEERRKGGRWIARVERASGLEEAIGRGSRYS